MAQTNCRFFNGYKPCDKIDSLLEGCSSSCRHYDVPKTRVLLIHLGALGAVVRTTALLPAIRAKYPGAHITWVTDAPGDLLLKGNPFIDRVITANSDGALEVSALTFDVAMVVDKSLKAAGLLKSTRAREVFGFGVSSRTGAVLPLNEAARPLWEVGLSNRIKFKENQKTEAQLVHEALELGPWRGARPSLHLSDREKLEVVKRRYLWSLGGRSAVIGVNTGCASTLSAKKLSVDGHVKLLVEMDRLRRRRENDTGRKGDGSVVLLGGKEDTARNQLIAEKAGAMGLLVTQSATEYGLRDGMISVAACDVVVSGDSLGLHMALGFRKPVVAWFGPTCAHEIDLGGGVAIMTSAPCSPCWNRSCEKPIMCYDQVDFEQMAIATNRLAMLAQPNRPELRPETIETQPESTAALTLEIDAEL